MKATTSTKSLKEQSIERNWHLIDISGKVLGRTTPEIAKLLQGKHKRNYASYLDCGDYVVVINAKKLVVTGHKADQKTYTHYSGYPGGLRTKTFATLMEKNPKKIIENAVSGMLPKNKFRSDRLRRMYIFEDAKHPYEEKFKKSL